MIPSTSARGGRAAALSSVPGMLCRAAMTCALLLGTLTLLLPATSFAQDEGGPAALKVHPEAARLNAEALIAEGNYRDAGRYLQKYLNGNPTDEEAWLLQASVFEHIKRYDLAERALSRAGEVRGVYLARARIAFKQDKFPEALAAVRKALERDPEYADAHHFLGYLLITQKQYAEAVESLRTADEKGTHKPAANAYYWGQALFELKDYDAAELQFRRVAELNPESDYVKPAEDFLDLIGLRRDQQAKKNAPAAASAQKKAAGAGAPKKDWSAYTQLLLEYDTNVELLPDNSALLITSATPGKKSAFRSSFAGGGDFSVLKSGSTEYHLTGDLQVLAHFNNSARDAQVVSLQGGGYANIAGKLGAEKMMYVPFLLGRTVFFGTFGTPLPGIDEYKIFGRPFSIEAEPGMRLLMQQGQRGFLTATLSYVLSRFTTKSLNGAAPQSERDAHTFRLGYAQTRVWGMLGQDNLKLTGGLKAGLRFAEDQNYSYWALEPDLRAEWRPIEVFVVEGNLRYRYENHYKSPTSAAAGLKKRVDQTIGARLGTRYRLMKEDDFRLWLVAQYLFEGNLSTNDTPPVDLEYHKHVISLGIRATF